MKRSSTVLLRGAIVLIALAVLALCIILLPLLIFRSDVAVYYRPILIGMYIPAIPFFFALYQAWKILSYIDNNKTFSELPVKALDNIKRAGIIIGGLYILGMPYFFHVANKDDAPGVVLLPAVIAFASFTIATFAGVLQKLLQNAIEIKSENDLTV